MSKTMRKVKGHKVRESGTKTRLRDVPCVTAPPSKDALDQGAQRLADWLAGNTRVMYDEEVSDD